MAIIKMKINYSNYTQPSEEMPYTIEDGNNISHKQGLTTKGTIGKPFLLNYSKLDGRSTLSSKYEGIISYESSDSEGNCNFNFQLPSWLDYDKGIEPIFMTIQFDQNFGTYATEIQVIRHASVYDGGDQVYTFENNSSFAIIEIPPRTATKYFPGIDVIFTKWSEPNSPIIIDSIQVNNAIETYDTKHIKDLSLIKQVSTNDDGMPDFGIFGKVGSLKLFDFESRIKGYIKSGILASNCKVEIFLNSKRMGIWYTDKISYDYKDNVFSVSLVDRAKFFQNDYLEQKPYNKLVNQTNAYFLLRDMVNAYNQQHRLEANYTDLLLSNFSSAITFPRSIHLLGYPRDRITMQQALNYWCEFALHNVYLNDEDDLEVVDNV